MRASTPACGVLSFVLACTTAAQAVWRVPGDGPLATVITNASPGDVVLVEVPFLQGFTLNKGLTIIGPSVVRGGVNGQGVFCCTDTILDIPPGQHARLVDLTFLPATPPGIGGGIVGRVIVRGGSATFEQCTIRGRAGRNAQGALRVRDADAHLLHCDVTGARDPGNGHGSPAVWTENARLTVVGGTFVGSDATFDPNTGTPAPARPALELGSSTLHASGITATGGSGFVIPGVNVLFGATAILADAASTVWLTDASVSGGGCTGCPAGDGVQGPLRHARSAIAGGAGTPPGVATVGNALADPDLAGISDSMGLRLGQAYALTGTAGAPGVPVVLLASADLVPLTTPIIAQPTWLGGVSIFAAGGVTDAASTWTFAVNVPNVETLRYGTVWFHVLAIPGALPAQIAPPTGGVIF